MTVSKNPLKIKNMFNSIAEEYDFNNNLISLGLHNKVKQFAIKNLTLKNNMRVLDECTGTGDIAYLLTKQNPNIEVIGIDFSEKMTETARKKHPGITFLRADCTKLPFLSNSFDIVTMSFGLRNIEDYKQAIKESFRVLEDGGKFLYLDFGDKNFFSKSFDILTEILIQSEPYKYLIKSKADFFTPGNLIKEFEKEGFIFKLRKDYLFGIISMLIFEKGKTAFC